MNESQKPTIFSLEHVNKLHRRAQRAESEATKLRRRLAPIQHASDYWFKRFHEEVEKNRRLRSEYNDLWRIIRAVEGKHIDHAQAVKALQDRLHRSLVRKFIDFFV